MIVSGQLASTEISTRNILLCAHGFNNQPSPLHAGDAILVSNPDPSLFRSAGCIASPAHGGKGLATLARFSCFLEEFA